MNTLRQIKNVIYGLKRSFGQPLIFITPSREYDIRLGTVTNTPTTYTVKRALVLEAGMQRMFVASLKGFTIGGLFDKSKRMVIVDQSDADNLTLDMYCTYESQKWSIVDLSTLDPGLGSLMILSRIEGE